MGSIFSVSAFTCRIRNTRFADPQREAIEALKLRGMPSVGFTERKVLDSRLHSFAVTLRTSRNIK